ncbi:MAG: hypothetical protein ACREMY_09155, partial [bacterium]
MPLTIVHFGTDPRTLGSGIASVVRCYQELSLPGLIMASETTYRSRREIFGLVHLPRAIRRLRSLDRRNSIAHFHLSHRGSFLREGALLRYAYWQGIPSVVTIHGSGFDVFAERHPQLVRVVLTNAKGIAALSPKTETILESLGLGPTALLP